MNAEKHLPPIEGKVVRSEDVHLDGHRWLRCRFYDCNIIVERGDFEVLLCEFHRCKLQAKGDRARAILNLAKLFYPDFPLISE
jgi:hypothetical protein